MRSSRCWLFCGRLKAAGVWRPRSFPGGGGTGFAVGGSPWTGGHSALRDAALGRREGGGGDPAEVAGGLTAPAPDPAAREVWLLQRKPEKPGRGLGKTTGWIHRAALQAKGVRMWGGVSYLGIGPEGLRIARDGGEELLAVDDVVLCAGQVPERGLADQLAAAGIAVQVIGGADVAAELDAKRAIDQGARVAAGL